MDSDKAWVLTVGAPYAPERTIWPSGGFEWRYQNGQLMMQLCLGSPTEEEKAAFRESDVDVAFYRRDGVFFFLFRIEGCMDWSDQAFALRRLPEECQAIADMPAGAHQFVTLVLVNAFTGIVEGLRVATFNPRMTQWLHDELRRQAALPFSQAEQQAIIDREYARFPKSKDMARAALLMGKLGRAR